MLEWGGSEDPSVEEKVSKEREQAYRGVEQQSRKEGEDLLRDLQGVLAKRGIEATPLPVEFEGRMFSDQVGEALVRDGKQVAVWVVE
jgi:hypothetical protein